MDSYYTQFWVTVMHSIFKIIFQFHEYCARGLSKFKSCMEVLRSAYIINIVALKGSQITICILLVLYTWDGYPGHLVCRVCNSDSDMCLL